MTPLPNVTSPLSEADMITAMTAIMNGQCGEYEIEQFLRGLAMRGETVDEITGAAKVLRSKASAISAPVNAVDCCGTGGDASGTYNISTAVALVAAACGVPIAKHGNRAASSKSGTADVLEALGINFDLKRGQLEEALRSLNYCFLMAPHHHSAMKHVAMVRKKMKTRTIFNLLGPLANPAGTRHQLIGVYDQKWVLPLAQVLQNLGTESAWVVHGRDGLDEITVTDATDIAILKDGKITQTTLTAADFGLPVHNMADLKGGDADHNAAALRALLEGQRGAYRDIVLANTAAVLIIAGFADTLPAGVKLAATTIDSGAAYQLLKDYINFSREDMDA